MTPAIYSPQLTAFEHRPIPIGEHAAGAGLTNSEADYLSILSELRPGFCERGYRSVRLAQYCGVVSLGERMLEILPKVADLEPAEECRGVLLRLLREAEEFPLFQHLSVGQHLRRAPLLEVFIAAFFDAVTEIIRGGLLRQYQVHEEDLQVVRGCIVASRQFAVHSNRPDRIACRFDDLTANNVWNQLIKTGLGAVRPWIRSVELNRRWVELMAVFDEVDETQVEMRDLKRLVFNRHAMRYRVVADWVRWILSLQSPDLRAGQNESPGLLFDMNLLFQSAIASVLRRRAGAFRNLQVSSQDTGSYLASVSGSATHRAFGLRPDVVMWRGAQVAAIGDTKWKRVEVSRSGYLKPTPADIYQMHAYATKYQCERLALIYPWYEGLLGSKETSFELPSVGELRPRVDVLCVDVHSDSFDLRSGGATREGFAALFA
ncbi:MAG: McrC family protein [Thiobacillus sp.]|nr:McrC family protein [Thiobacillus sp.]